jgi:hypothetical protein
MGFEEKASSGAAPKISIATRPATVLDRRQRVDRQHDGSLDGHRVFKLCSSSSRAPVVTCKFSAPTLPSPECQRHCARQPACIAGPFFVGGFWWRAPSSVRPLSRPLARRLEISARDGIVQPSPVTSQHCLAWCHKTTCLPHSPVSPVRVPPDITWQYYNTTGWLQFNC